VSKLHQAEPQGESAQHDEARPDHWGMVNAAVVQGRIMVLPGEICQPITGAVEQSLRRCALTWQKSAEDENLGLADRRVVGKGPKAV